MLRLWSSKHKIFWAILLTATLPLLFTTIIVTKIAENALEKQVINNLSSVANLKVSSIEDFIKQGKDDANFLVQMPIVISTILNTEMSIKNNINNPSELFKATQDFRDYANIVLGRSESNFTNILLLSTKGTILFSAKHPDLIGKNFMQTSLKNSKLSGLFKDVVTLVQTQVSDFETIENDKNPQAFIVSPVIDKHALIGVLALQMSNESITQVVNNLESLGATGETLVGSIVNNKIIPEVPLRFTDISGFIQHSQQTDNNLLKAFEDATQGGIGQGLLTDYRDKSVIAAWRYVPTYGWGMLVKIDKEEEYAPIELMKKNMLILGIAALLIAITIATIISVRLQNAENSLKKALEELNIAVKEAENANQVKSHFLASMSHELRTPLNAIIGYTEMLTEDSSDLKLTSFERDLNRIDSSAKHLLTLINDILDFSKIEAGRIELHLEDTDVYKLINSIKDLIGPQLAKNNNTFVLDCPSDIGTIHTDITRLSQSLLNLLTNASKFTKDGEIKFSVVRDTSSAGDWYRFIVSDNGIGISPDHLEFLFQPFRQADATITRKYGGTGLGLNIAKRFCQMLGGDITVASEIGKGSTFIIHLPAISTQGVEKNTTVQPQLSIPVKTDSNDNDEIALKSKKTASTEEITILIVDDDRTIHKELSIALEKINLKTLHAFNGEEGIKLAKKYRPNLIVLDIDMPVMDGWSALSAIRTDATIHSIPVMIISMSENKDLSFALNATDYLTKPINNEKLLELIHKNLKNNDVVDIMVVDDDPSMRNILSRSIKKSGLTVIEIENGKAALDYLKHTKILPSLMLLDIMMPELDGYGVIDAVKKHPIWHTIPIIVITAKELSAEEKIVIQSGAQDIFIKGSYSPRELINVISAQVKSITKI